MAITQVESGGSGYDPQGRIKVLFEKHKFYAHTVGQVRDAAVKAGLARRKWISPANGGYSDQPNNPAALKLLTQAMALDEAAALKSASYGAGQIMGENYKLCGWETVEDFVSDMVESEDAQIQAMFGFLKGRSLVDEMQAKDFAAIAGAYNGPGQVDAYAAKMRAAYKKLSNGKEPKVESKVRANGLRMGSSGYRVNALQERLNKLGYAVQVDGDFGDATRRAVIAFQVDNDLKPDGLVGPGTEEALDNASSIISDERAGATMQDLRDHNSTIVKSGDTTQAVGLLGGGVAAIGGVANSGIFEKVQDTVGSFSVLAPLADPMNTVLQIAAHNWWILVGGAGVGVWFLARRIKKARLNLYRTGQAVR